uniref:DUF305 domain-containing protein n=1 Tax=Oscillatoriales cyanobacterium SpSt-402 TaxID=2282168 RepID=A0A832HAG8_9CYAN
MKQPAFKSTLLGFAIVSVAFSSNVLTACSSTSQASSSQNQTASSTATGNKQMNHGGMNHDKASGMNHGMDLGPANEEFDLRFIDAMIPHHEGAVVMAKEVLQKSQRPEMKKLANEIIRTQAKEIAQMKAWRAAWYPKAPNQPVAWHSEMGHSMTMTQDQVKSMMMSMDLGAADPEFDLRFLNAMIPHHEGALIMAQDLLGKSKRPEIRELAKSIITSQEAEIAQMKQWRKAWYGK